METDRETEKHKKGRKESKTEAKISNLQYMNYKYMNCSICENMHLLLNKDNRVLEHSYTNFMDFIKRNTLLCSSLGCIIAASL